MNIANIARQTSAGIIVGLSAIIYSISYGALLFSGPLASLTSYAITASLITAAVGALYGWISAEKTFISGPDANTVSVMLGMLAIIGILGSSQALTLNIALGAVFLTSIICALSFYAVAKLNLAELVRYIPFSVMAGFLAATGWLMSSGALSIIAGMPLTLAGLADLTANPFRPELLSGLLIVAIFFGLASRVSSGILIPAVMLIASIAINIFLASGICSTASCSAEAWLFTGLQATEWLPPWELQLGYEDIRQVLQHLPDMLVVSFVGLLTILLSLASLELNYKKEFDLHRVLRAHAASTSLSALLGGFVNVISIGRTVLNQQTGGGRLSCAIAALMCVGMLFGAGGILAYLPKAVLGGLILYLGVSMLKQWLWDQHKTSSRVEMGQIILIVLLVANYGYVVGFFAGVAIACVIFIITYSQVPIASLTTDLSLFSSSVVRPQQQMDILHAHGHKTVLYRLRGYVFFGSASKIDTVFQGMDIHALDGIILDFSEVSGIDKSAIGVFQRVLRRYDKTPVRFYFVYTEAAKASLQAISDVTAVQGSVSYFASLDHAIEIAEESIINQQTQTDACDNGLDFLVNAEDRRTFLGYCELRRVGSGEMLCRDGDYSDEIYFIEDGSFEVMKQDQHGRSIRLAKLNKGAIVGELAFYTGEARSASIQAAVDSGVHVLRREALERMRLAHREIATDFDHMVIRKIARTLARTNRLVSTLG